MKISTTIVSLGAALLLFNACALKEEVVTYKQQPVQKAQKQIAMPQKAISTPQVQVITGDIFANAKEMKCPTLLGKTISIKGEDNLLKITNTDYEDKEVLLYLFGRDCSYCTKEVAQIKKLAKKPNLKIIGIHAHKMIGDKALKAYAKKVGYHFDILSFKNDIILIRYLKKSGLWYGGTPTHLLIDKGGNVHNLSIPEILNR